VLDIKKNISCSRPHSENCTTDCIRYTHTTHNFIICKYLKLEDKIKLLIEELTEEGY